jgi:hypothetical protein
MKRMLQACGRCAHCLRRAQLEVVFQRRLPDGRVVDPIAERRCARHARRGGESAALQGRRLPEPARLFPGFEHPLVPTSVLRPAPRRTT